jgi:hypothetical protein
MTKLLARVTVTVAAVVRLLFVPEAAVAQCCGDCNGDGQVTIDEILTTVNRALSECRDDGVCDASVAGCNANLSTCNASLSDTQATLTGCQQDLQTCQQSAQRFPATGQTTCWAGDGTAIDCSGTGQDGEVQAGGALAFVDNGDGTITDLNTHLMWEKKSDDGSLHDWNDGYLWADALGTFIPDLNAGDGFAGHTDWRLPNVKELQTIVDYGTGNPAVGTAFNTDCTPGCTVTACSCTQPGTYWSSTTDVNAPLNAWSVYFGDGSMGLVNKTGPRKVRAVRGGGS